MANNIGWGKGASNNSIGWGNVGTNGFGSIYRSSNSGETDLAGVTSPSAAFKQRVIDDNGTFEAQQCLDDLINQGLFENSNFVLTPNGYKAGKIYALKPDSGDLDVTWVRNGNATRVNANGLIESVVNDVPRLDYTNGDCPSLLVEEQATNLFTYSEQFDNASWRKIRATVTSNSTTSPDGSSSADKLIANQINSTHAVVQTISIVSGTTYSFSFYAKAAEITKLTVGEGLSATFLPDSGYPTIDIENKTVTGVNNWNVNVEDSVNGFVKVKGFFTSINTGNDDGITIYLVGQEGNRVFEGNNIDGAFIWGAQLEEGTEATSYTPTNGSIVTRPADAPQPIIPPIGTTEIIEVFEDGTTNTITTIPVTYTVPFGRFKYILFN